MGLALWYGQFTRAHARGGRLGLGLRVRIRVSLVVWEMGACALWKKKKGRLRIIRSKDGAPIVRRA